MATLTAVNPRIVSGPPLQRLEVLATDAQTWKAGQWGAYSSGLASPVASDATVIQFVFLADQDTATSTSTVSIARITADHVFEMNELDGTMADANRGESYGIDVTGNVVTIDVGDTSNLAVKVIDIGSNYEPERNDSADVKARCWAHLLTSVAQG